MFESILVSSFIMRLKTMGSSVSVTFSNSKHRMMGSLHAQRKLRRKKDPVTCPNVLTLTGVIGRNVLENSVDLGKLDQGPELVTAFQL